MTPAHSTDGVAAITFHGDRYGGTVFLFVVLDAREELSNAD